MLALPVRRGFSLARVLLRERLLLLLGRGQHALAGGRRTSVTRSSGRESHTHPAAFRSSAAVSLFLPLSRGVRGLSSCRWQQQLQEQHRRGRGQRRQQGREKQQVQHQESRRRQWQPSETESQQPQQQAAEERRGQQRETEGQQKENRGEQQQWQQRKTEEKEEEQQQGESGHQEEIQRSEGDAGLRKKAMPLLLCLGSGRDAAAEAAALGWQRQHLFATRGFMSGKKKSKGEASKQSKKSKAAGSGSSSRGGGGGDEAAGGGGLDKRMRRILRVVGGGSEEDAAAVSSSGGASSGSSRRSPGSAGRAAARTGAEVQEQEKSDRAGGGGGRGSVHEEQFDIQAVEKSMRAAIEKMAAGVAALAPHRAKPEVFENVPTQIAGHRRPLSDYAQVVARSATVVSVHVFSDVNVPKVMSALRAADPTWTLQEEADGSIKVQLPKLNDAMREQLKAKMRALLVTAKSDVRNLRQAGRSQLHRLQFKVRSIDDNQRRQLDVELTALMEARLQQCDKVYEQVAQHVLP